MSMIAIFLIAASDDLGGRIWGHPVPLNRSHWTTLKSCLDLEKCFLLCFFDTPNSPCEVTASEAAEAGLIVTMTWPTLSTTHMQSFNLLALKLCICIGNRRTYRQLLWLRIFIVRFGCLIFIARKCLKFNLSKQSRSLKISISKASATHQQQFKFED